MKVIPTERIFDLIDLTLDFADSSERDGDGQEVPLRVAAVRLTRQFAELSNSITKEQFGQVLKESGVADWVADPNGIYLGGALFDTIADPVPAPG